MIAQLDLWTPEGYVPTTIPHVGIIGHEMLLKIHDAGRLVACSCGWVLAGVQATVAAARNVFRKDHVAPIRAERRNRCRVCFESGLPMASNPAAGNICKGCLTAKTRDWAEANPLSFERRKYDHHLRREFGITIEDYDAIVIYQNGLCAICGDPPGRRREALHVDHDHETGMIRGLLCFRCNAGLGSFRDSPLALASASEYLKRSRGETDEVTTAELIGDC